jgi:hypothetical protein
MMVELAVITFLYANAMDECNYVLRKQYEERKFLYVVCTTKDKIDTNGFWMDR